MPTINKLPLLGTPSGADQIPVYAPNSGDARRMSITALTDYMQGALDLPDNSDEVSFLQAGTGAVTRTVQSKLREIVSVEDFGAVGDGVTDDTAAIKAAITYAQNKSSTFIYWSEFVIVHFGPGKNYKVTGNNPLGMQRPDNTPVRYGLDLRGAEILWYPSSASDVLLDRMANVYGFYMVNGNVALYNQNVVPENTFLATKGASLTTRYWSNAYLCNLFLHGQNGKWDTLFDIDGSTMTDQTNVVACTFMHWKTIFKSTNNEAVSWNFQGCNATTLLAHETFKFLSSNFSGDFIYEGSVICTNTGKFLEYKSSVNNASVGNVIIRARVEFRQQTTIVDANNGDIVFEGTNFLAGAAPLTNIIAQLDYCPNVTFRNCTVASNVTFVARPESEINTFAVFRRGTLTYDNCRISLYRPTIKYVDSAGATITYKSVVDSGLITPMLNSVGTVFGYTGMVGRCPPRQNSYLQSKLITTYIDVDNIGGAGYPYLIAATGTGFRLFQNMIIRSIKWSSNAAAAGIYSEYGILIDTETTPNALLKWTNSGSEYINYEVIPSTKKGIAYVSSDPAALFKTIYPAALNVATGTWVKNNQSLIGSLEITLEPLWFRTQLPATDNTIALV
jgi:hypothetical protein